MAILKPQQIERFIKTENIDLLGILLFGPNTEKIKTTANKLATAIAKSIDDPFDIVILDETSFKDTPGLLRDEMMALSFTGNRKVIWVKEPGAGFSNQVKGLFESLNQGNLLIVEAGQLKKTAAIRKVFENADAAAAVAYYEDTLQDLSGFIRSAVNSSKIEIEPAAVSYLIETTGTNRGLIQSELEKLICYCLPRKTITAFDVKTICNDPLTESLDELCDRIFLGNLADGLDQLRQLFSSGVEPSFILNTLELHANRLVTFRFNTNNTGNLEAIVRSARPPIFFKRQGAIKEQIHLWNEKSLRRVIAAIFDAIATTRRNSELSMEVCERTLISIGKTAQKSSSR